MKVRLDKLLSGRGVCSRREAAALIARGSISYAEDIRLAPDVKVEPELVRFMGKPLDPELLYILINKPEGTVCSHEDAGRLIYDLLPERFLKRSSAVNTAGRLDKDTTGVLLITDDGALNHRLLSPKHHVSKIYEVWTREKVYQAQADRLREGGRMLDGEKKPLLPAEVRLIPEGEADFKLPSEIENSEEPEYSDHLFLTITEGRFHQVKRMFEALNNEVAKLHRCGFAGLNISGLEFGKWRFLTESEIDVLKNM